MADSAIRLLRKKPITITGIRWTGANAPDMGDFTAGLPRTVDPRDALLEEVHRTAGAVAFLQERVAELQQADLVWGVTHEDEQQATEFPGTNIRREAKPSIWLVLYQAERKHLVDVCARAIAAGIEERRVRMAESLGLQLASVIRAFAEGLALSPEQWELVPGLAQRILLPLTAGGVATGGGT